nr:MAG TPA: hypothetical protein [Caudoviricetes sp.]
MRSGRRDAVAFFLALFALLLSGQQDESLLPYSKQQARGVRECFIKYAGVAH